MQTLLENPFFSFALIIIGFGFLIFVHELGHFLVAKLVGIKTTQFAIGFGQSLLTWRKGLGFRFGTTEPEYEKLLKEGADPSSLGETEYRLNYIPLGGYVKMLGQEDMDPSARSEDPRAFNNKSVSARFAVISAGVIMNVIFGMIFFVIAFMSGVMFPPAIVGAVQPGSPAATTYAVGHENDPNYLGLELDDKITHIDGGEIGDMMDVKYATILARKDTAIEMTIERGGEAAPLIYKIKPKVDEDLKLLLIGIDAPLDLEVAEVTEGSAIETAGVMKGMAITAVDGKPIETYGGYYRAVADAQGRPVTVTFSDPKSDQTADVTHQAVLSLRDPEKDKSADLMGLIPATRVLGIQDKSAAADSGLQAGDLVAAIGSLAWPGVVELQKAVEDAGDSPVSLTVMRDNKPVTIDPIKPKRGKLGIALGYATDLNIVSHTAGGSPVDSATNFVRGSRIVSLNGQAIGTFGAIHRALTGLKQAEGGVTVTLGYEVNLADHPVETAEVELDAADLGEVGLARWVAPLPEGMPIANLQVPVVGDNPMDSMALGFTKTHQFITQTYTTLLRLFQRTVPADKLSGPVGIVHQGTIIAERGWGYLLFFLGLISVNLAVINFLPIPITDGGQAIFLAIEKLKGSPVSVQVQTVATLVGLALLGCVFLFVTYNDVLRLLGMA